MQKIKGRPVLPGTVRGQALVSHRGFNTLASLKKSGVHSKKVVCTDHNNPDLYGKIITGSILCLPYTIGSTAGGHVFQRVVKKGLGPKAMLFSERIDPLAAAGVILADIWTDSRIVTVDQLGPEFLETVREGQGVEVKQDGTVIIIQSFTSE
jgi:predicted aconitase with swiveling domain